MLLLWILLVLIILTFLFIFICTTELPSIRTYRLGRKIHGLSGLPVIGNLYEFATLQHDGIMDYIQTLHQRFPRLARFEIAGVVSVLMQEPEDIQALYGNTNNITKGREYNALSCWLNDGLLLSSGTKWHSRRKLLTPAFHFKILKDSVASINNNSAYMAQRLLETNGDLVKVSEFVTKCTLDIIGETAMGIEIQAQTGVGDDYMKSVKDACSQVIDRILSPYLHKDWMFNLTPGAKHFYNNMKILHDFTKKIVGERKSGEHLVKRTNQNEQHYEDDKEYTGKIRRNFLDALLEVQKNDPESLKDEDIYEEVDTFMFEGHDTVSTSIMFSLLLLGCHPVEQDLAVKELEDIFGDSDRDITIEDSHKMVYLEKVIKESLRLYPSVPWMSRTLTQDCILDDGVVLPAKANCIIITYYLHRNERFFPNPERFDPERFSDKASLNRHPYAYLPFSAGPRNCIGQKFAMLEMKITLANVLRKVRIEAVTKRNFKIIPSIIAVPSKPIICKFYPRQKE